MNGSLARTPLTELVRRICDRGDSVVLRLEPGSPRPLSRARTQIYFREGNVVFASSENPQDKLGERLIREGSLSRDQLELACRVQSASRMRLGATLVEMGCLDVESLDARLREQVAAIVLASFGWRSGSFDSAPTVCELDSDLERLDLSTMDLLLDGIRTHADASMVRAGLEALETTPLYVAESATSAFAAGLGLTPSEGFVLSRVDGGSTASQIARVSPLGEDETYRCLYSLITMGLVRLDSMALTRAGVGPGVAVEVGVDSGEDLGAEVKVNLKVRVEAEVSSEPVRPLAKPSGLGRELAPEVIAFGEAMAAKHARLGSLNHYELLDVSPSATPAEMKQAYFSLVKRLHPDHRAGLGLGDPDGVFAELYLAVKTAYDVLGSETDRRAYDAWLRKEAPATSQAKSDAATPGPAFEPEHQARIHFKNGQRFFDAGQFHEAIEELRNAVRLDDRRADYHRLLGRALGKNPRWRKLAEEELMRALMLNRFDASTYVDLGELYRDSGLRTRARKMFEEAVGIDPDNPRALQGLELESR